MKAALERLAVLRGRLRAYLRLWEMDVHGLVPLIRALQRLIWRYEGVLT